MFYAIIMSLALSAEPVDKSMTDILNLNIQMTMDELVRRLEESYNKDKKTDNDSSDDKINDSKEE